MKLFTLLALLSLTGCSTVAIKAPPVVFTPATVPDPSPMNLSTVQWKVYNANDIKALSSSLNASNSKSFVLYGLDNKNFQSLDSNIQDMYRYILEVNSTKEFYKNLELKENQPVDNSKKTK